MLGPSFTTFQLGNPVGARRDQSLVDRVALAEKLEATKEAGAARHLLELFVRAELRGRKLVEIDMGSWQTCMLEVASRSVQVEG
jgi:hypothetical protein